MGPELLKTAVATLLSKLDVEVSGIEVSSGHRTVISIESPDSKRLIGPHGEHLRALNMMARRLIEAEHGEEAANFLVDVNGYHEEKMETVRQSARMLAQRARLFKHDVELPAMSSYERLVVHELFSDDPEIKTESQGEGKFRHIVLKYKEKTGSY
ncbi:MAG: R3H domain-containing nucleic acid-binding protein [Candidatus Adlerbacteria bacterium]|nr:R3H domain-containing nucleic acid-binding protein [Candidatus Adlerbacteria bacterium]MDZ4226027.1 R3H domain-containing nucleic acid-binding protein [Patescibacteria group bacterium]